MVILFVSLFILTLITIPLLFSDLIIKTMDYKEKEKRRKKRIEQEIRKRLREIKSKDDVRVIQRNILFLEKETEYLIKNEKLPIDLEKLFDGDMNIMFHEMINERAFQLYNMYTSDFHNKRIDKNAYKMNLCLLLKLLDEKTLNYDNFKKAIEHALENIG